MNLFQVVDIGKNHYSVVIEQPLGSLYVNSRIFKVTIVVNTLSIKLLMSEATNKLTNDIEQSMQTSRFPVYLYETVLSAVRYSSLA